MITLKYNGRDITIVKVGQGGVSIGGILPMEQFTVAHAMYDRIEELEAQLASVGAGGVSKLCPVTENIAANKSWEQQARADVAEFVGNQSPVESVTLKLLIDTSDAVKELEALEARAAKLQPLTNAEIDAIADSMPDGLRGFCKSWGYQQFARKVLDAANAKPDTLEAIAEWFGKAFPNVDDKARAVQFGVHLEEVAESLEAIFGVGDSITVRLHELADDFKANKAGVFSAFLAELTDSQRADLCDAMVDQLVTGIGVMKFMGFDIMGAVRAVIAANYDKFVDGKPIYKPNGKLDKRPGWEAPNLVPFSRKAV